MKTYALFLTMLLAVSAAASARPAGHFTILVSVPDQRMMLFNNGVQVAAYPVSTSRFGVGDRPGSCRTPLGALEIAKKIGAGAPEGSVFKGRRRTGEIVPKNSPGRDPIVTRILWLDGLEARNGNAFDRGIYIHGTPQESLIGRPASYGCIRMRSRDIVGLYRVVTEGTRVHILNVPVSSILRRIAENARRRDAAS